MNQPPGVGDADLNGPQQVFDQVAAGGDARRQSQGRLSWCAVVVPVKDHYPTSGADPNLTPTGAWIFRMDILVFKDRVTGADPNNTMPTARVDSRHVGISSPLSTVYLENVTDPFDARQRRLGDADQSI